MTLRISERLRRIAALVPNGAHLVDVGTDHALLPVYLVQHGTISHAIATDVAEGPVHAARGTVRMYGLENIVDVRFGDGLATVQPGEVDTIVIAGMGGGTAREILERSPMVAGAAKRLIIQPMNASREVRRYMCEAGFGLVHESVFTDDGRTYELVAADRDKPAREAYLPYAEDRDAENAAFEFGPLLLSEPSPAFISYVADTYKQWTHILSAMAQSQSSGTSARRTELDRKVAWLKVWLTEHGEDPIDVRNEGEEEQ